VLRQTVSICVLVNIAFARLAQGARQVCEIGRVEFMRDDCARDSLSANARPLRLTSALRLRLPLPLQVVPGRTENLNSVLRLRRIKIEDRAHRLHSFGATLERFCEINAANVCG